MIGAGPRGRAFALRCACAGYAVVLEDVLSSNLRKAAQEIADAAEPLESRLTLAGSVEEAVRAADVAIDFVPDELESKLEIFSMMDRMAPPRTVFCTPTRLSIYDLASCTYRPGQCVGLEPFGDQIGTEGVLVRGEHTAEESVARVMAWLATLGMQVQVRWDEQERVLVQSR